MRAGWCAVAIVNLAWCAVLWRHRRSNHSWLLPFFLLYTLTDCLMLAWSPGHLGGFAILGPTSGPWWVFVASLAWLLWFVAPPVAALGLWRGRLPVVAGPLLVGTACALSAVELWGGPAQLRRTLMHAVFEPLCLIAALVFAYMYSRNVIAQGAEKGLDYLAFAIRITTIMLLLKIGLILKDGILVKWMAYAFHGLYMAAAVGYYVFRRKYLIPWLLSRS